MDPNFRPVNNSTGFSIIEVMAVIGIISISILALLTMQSNQQKANNFLEFQLKRTQLQGTLFGQFLKDPNNCSCLFSGASSFPSTGTTLLAITPAPTQIGLYTSLSPSCGTPAQFLIDSVGVDGLRMTEVGLKNISPTTTSNIYTGQFYINIQSTKDILGPKDLPINIPVSIATTPAGADVNFVNCSTSSTSTTTNMGISGTEVWVRRADGFLEQWGFASGFSGAQSAITITFPKPFTDTNYNLILTTVIPGTGDYDNYVQEINGTRTTTSVSVFSQDPSSGGSSVLSGVRWHATGL